MKQRSSYNHYGSLQLTPKRKRTIEELESSAYEAETEEYLYLEPAEPDTSILAYNTTKDQFHKMTLNEDEEVVHLVRIPRVHVLSKFKAYNLPEKFLRCITLEDADFMSLDWGDCYPVCYDDSLTIDDIADSNGTLLWSGGDTNDLVFHDEESADYLIPKGAKKING